MKFHRVEGKFPAGVSPSIGTTHVPSLPSFFKSWRDLFDLEEMTIAQRVERLTSTEPTKITLDVPEAAATETARVLRAMADELEGGK